MQDVQLFHDGRANLGLCHVTQSEQKNKLGKFFWLNFLKNLLMFFVYVKYSSKCASLLLIYTAVCCCEVKAA